MRKLFSSISAILCIAVLASAAFAAVTFEPSNGTGFVGKGDVQLVYGWNNRALQENAEFVGVRAASAIVTEVTWECTNSNNDRVQERERTTTTTRQGLVTTVGRLKNQITGFNLEGYRGVPTETTTTDGPAVNSCPGSTGQGQGSPWWLSAAAGDPVVVTSSQALEVSIDATTWHPLP